MLIAADIVRQQDAVLVVVSAYKDPLFGFQCSEIWVSESVSENFKYVSDHHTASVSDERAQKWVISEESSKY